MLLQDRAQFLQALAVDAGQRVAHLVKASINALKRHVLVGRRAVGLEEAINTRPQHRGVLPHEPILFARLIDHHLLVEAQLGQDLRPAFGDRLLDDGQVKDAGLDHLQHVLHRQARVDPLHLDRRLLVQGQFLVDLVDRIRRRAAGGQRQCAPGQLLQPGEPALALDPHQP